MLADALLDLVDRDAAVMRLEDVVQHFLRRFERDRAAEQVGMRDQPVERALELAHVGGDLVREELDHLRRHLHVRARGLRLEDRDAQLEGRGVQVRDHAATEPRAQPVLMPDRSEGDLSAERTICLPASTSALKVWKNSSCVLSLPMRNCRSSIISTSTLRSCSLNSIVDCERIAAMKRYMNFSADM